MGKLFFNIIGKLGIVLCVCLTIMACADDMAEQVNNESSKATVNLTFNTRANEGDIDANEGIKTLRIIVTDEAGTILYNQKESGLGDVERHTVSIELPKTKVRFYVFANEESMGREFDTEGLEQDGLLAEGKLTSGNILGMAWTDTERAHFPKLATDESIAQFGLPMTGCRGVQAHDTYKDDGIPVDLTNKTVEQIEIPLVRCVIKIVVDITNAKIGDEYLDINAVNFGRFFPDKVYYYMHSNRTMPQGTNVTYHDFDLEPSVSIPQGEERTVCTVYTYPVTLPNSGDVYRYSIGLNDERDYKVFLTKNGERGNTYIPRNSRLVIKGTMSGTLTINWTDLYLVVCCWEDKNMDITFE